MSAAFEIRHLGPTATDQERMLAELHYGSLEELSAAVVPADILLTPEQALADLPPGCSEAEALAELSAIAAVNRPGRALIGLGYHGTATPALIQRHVLENPCWYTAYTPYQAEIAQGRLEALLNFQTLVCELTGLPIANASLLDEGTAAAEAMALSFAVCRRSGARHFLVDQELLPQTLAVLQTRAEPLGITLIPIAAEALSASLAAGEPLGPLTEDSFGLLLQLPGTSGRLWDPSPLLAAARAADLISTVAIDPLAQVLLAPVGSLGADIAIGSLQRYGVPLGFGGPHAAFFATREAYKRQIPGRLVGLSRDAEGNEALRLALQTREQHIRRDKATSNICTAQVLLAVMAGFYAVHHGPEGLEAIALQIVQQRYALAAALQAGGLVVDAGAGFDTVVVRSPQAATLLARAAAADLLLRHGVRGEGVLEEGVRAAGAAGAGAEVPGAAGPLGTERGDGAAGISAQAETPALAISLDECSTPAELERLLTCLLEGDALERARIALANGLIDSDASKSAALSAALAEVPRRRQPWLQQAVFQRYRSETELLRYIQHLASKDLSLVHGMIPLGSCTMKLNAAAELAPVSWPAFSQLHPFAPADRCAGYARLAADLEQWLATITGFAGVSLQPNAGSQGEYAGLLAIRAWHRSRGQGHRTICLIPTSAHGTNPASAVMAGLQVVAVACDEEGNIDLADLEAKAQLHADSLAALMVTYPSTHGVFEPQIRRICALVHEHGGQVYLDGANLNAQVGLCKPGLYGADVCHLNLHKTFCIPHGGGGPGVGPIAVASHLVPFLPGHPLRPSTRAEAAIQAIGPVSAAPLGSAGILPISWMYIRLMGGAGLRTASQVALLNANLIAARLDPHFPVLYRGAGGRVAHECILDLRPLKRSCGLEVDDLAKRLMDYGFHAPTVSWPVAGTVMVEPTESESLAELDRFCAAMVAIREEARAIEEGRSDPLHNPLKQAPHTLAAVTDDAWDRPYSRREAAFPAGPEQRHHKVWPAVARIDNAYGDRHLICTCPSVEELAQLEPVMELAA